MSEFDAAFYVGPYDEADKYQLESQVSGGGEAQLWRARLPISGQWEPVAVKVLRPERLAELDSWSARWAEQAELLRFIRHPGVVGVREHFDGPVMHKTGEADSAGGRSLYLVMNWVDGCDLREWVPQHRDSEDFFQGLRYLAQIADVLDWLHSGEATPSKRAVLHGDLTPANIIVGPTGQAVLVDFGLFHLAAQVGKSVEGTRGYMAPEVHTSGAYSAVSDRYGFGAVGYYVLTGQQPPTELHDISAGLAELPVLAADPRMLDNLLAIFSANPDDRPSAGEWVRLLRTSTTTGGHPVGLRPLAPGSLAPTPAPAASGASGRRHRAFMPALAALVAVAVAIVLALIASAGPSSRPSSGASSQAAALDKGDAGTTSLSPVLRSDQIDPPTVATALSSASVPGQVAGTTTSTSGSVGTTPTKPVVPASSPSASQSAPQAPAPTSAANAGTPQTAPPPPSQPTPTPAPGPTTYAEQEANPNGANTFTNYSNASGLGAKVSTSQWVQISCKVYAPNSIGSVNPDGYWYRIASGPWNNQYYAVANTFWNGDTPGQTPYTHNTDFNVPNC